MNSAISSLGVVILGAGASARMGKPKLLLPWRNTSILGHVTAQWRAVGAAQIAVVLDATNTALAAELDRLGFAGTHRIPNPQPERGMFSSIQCAAHWTGWLRELTHWAVTLGDQPHLRSETLKRLVQFAAAQGARICQPLGPAGRPRHPVILPQQWFNPLGKARDATFKEFLARHEAERAFCPLDDPGLDFDIDTPEDYEKALRCA